MKIAFISLNKEKLPDPVIPLGILYVVANTPEHHQKEFWDLCFEDRPKEFLQNKMEAFKPDLIAVGIRNIHNNSYSGISENLDYYRAIFEALRSLTKNKIILGGSALSVLPEEIMTALKPDLGIFGEGESTFNLVLNKLEKGQDNFNEIPNVMYFSDNKLRLNRTANGFTDTNSIKWPALEYLVPDYFDFAGINSIQTKRGCVYNCTYCSYPKIEGNICRLRTPSKVVEEILSCKERYGKINHFFIVDSVFNSPVEHAKQICRGLIDVNSKTPWTCYCNPIGFDEELAVLMSKANCQGVEIGSDSGNNNILKKLQKGFGTSSIINISKLCKENGIKDCHTFMLGTPGETLEDVKVTLDFIEELDPFCSIIMPWFDYDVNLNRSMAHDNILELLEQYSKNKTNCIVPVLNRNFNQKLFKFLRKNNFQGPLWYHIGLNA